MLTAEGSRRTAAGHWDSTSAPSLTGLLRGGSARRPVPPAVLGLRRRRLLRHPTAALAWCCEAPVCDGNGCGERCALRGQREVRANLARVTYVVVNSNGKVRNLCTVSTLLMRRWFVATVLPAPVRVAAVNAAEDDLARFAHVCRCDFAEADALLLGGVYCCFWTVGALKGAKV